MNIPFRYVKCCSANEQTLIYRRFIGAANEGKTHFLPFDIKNYLLKMCCLAYIRSGVTLLISSKYTSSSTFTHTHTRPTSRDKQTQTNIAMRWYLPVIFHFPFSHIKIELPFCFEKGLHTHTKRIKH